MITSCLATSDACPESSDIDSEIYVEPPKGFEKYDENGKSYVLKLKRALYGTKQASRMWQLKLRSHLITKMGFTNSSHDPCLFSRHWDDGTVILVGVYVDDIILAHNGIMVVQGGGDCF